MVTYSGPTPTVRSSTSTEVARSFLKQSWIKKSYRDKRHGKPRPRNLRSLEKEADDSMDEEKKNVESEEFLKDPEENPVLRFDIIPELQQRSTAQPPTTPPGDDRDAPPVPLEELPDDLDLNDEKGDCMDWITSSY